VTTTCFVCLQNTNRRQTNVLNTTVIRSGAVNLDEINIFALCLWHLGRPSPARAFGGIGTSRQHRTVDSEMRRTLPTPPSVSSQSQDPPAVSPFKLPPASTSSLLPPSFILHPSALGFSSHCPQTFYRGLRPFILSINITMDVHLRQVQMNDAHLPRRSVHGVTPVWLKGLVRQHYCLCRRGTRSAR
jgi:hypothetical protein